MIYAGHKTRLGLIWLATVWAAFAAENNKRELPVKSGSSHTLKEFLSVHESPIDWLSVGNKKYNYVMGSEPYYVRLPDRDWILFITSNELQDRFLYHFVSLRDGSEISIPVKSTEMFQGIGNVTLRNCHLSFESISETQIIVLYQLPDRWYRYHFDLKQKLVTRTAG